MHSWTISIGSFECFSLYSLCRDERVYDCSNKVQVSQERLDGSKPTARQDSSVSDVWVAVPIARIESKVVILLRDGIFRAVGRLLDEVKAGLV